MACIYVYFMYKHFFFFVIEDIYHLYILPNKSLLLAKVFSNSSVICRSWSLAQLWRKQIKTWKPNYNCHLS